MTPLTYLAIVTAILVLAVCVAVLCQRALLRKLTTELKSSSVGTSSVDLSLLSALPVPVQRYFRFALTDGQPIIRQVSFLQSGQLKADVTSSSWMPFNARHIATSMPAGFLWNADIRVLPCLSINVIDSVLHGIGLSRASIYSAITMATSKNLPQLNEAALHRYLAEAVWYPTSLLPQCGVSWTAIDDNCALATLIDSGLTVSLLFHFNNEGAVTSVSTPARYRLVRGGFQPTPWEGHFSQYALHDGMQIPMYGEVGWYDSHRLVLVWKGTITQIKFRY
ncbi:DUF6920 family protein [Alteromonas sp. H39]|uniref:DUF6920 family protein n=1 Tax=Alteromonas sp. H39 TaxID=3389876 RepID=UPI0039E0B30C